MIYNSLVGKLKGSDQQYRYLSSLMEWIKNTTFYPLPPYVDDVVNLHVVGLDDADVDTCEVCTDKAANLKYPELVRSVNWEDCDLKSIVSYILVIHSVKSLGRDM